MSENSTKTQPTPLPWTVNYQCYKKFKIILFEMTFDWTIKNKYSVILLIQKSFLKVLTPTTCKLGPIEFTLY